MGGRGLLLQVVFNVESVLGIKPGNSGVVIGYQVDECTYTWLAQYIVARSHIYRGFMGTSTLTHFPLEPECEDYSILYQVVADFEHGLDSILTDSFKPEWDVSFHEA